MSDDHTLPCPVDSPGDGVGCDGTAHLLFSGHVYCPECGHVFNVADKLTDSQLEKYDPMVREHINSEYEEVFDECLRILDMYYKEPLGFPNKQTYMEFMSLIPLLHIKYIEKRQDEMEKMRNKIESKMRATNSIPP